MEGLATAGGLRVAALDVDGTLVPAALGALLPPMLAQLGVCAPEGFLKLVEFVSANQLDEVAGARRALELFGGMLAGVACSDVAAVLPQVWEASRGRVYDFVPGLVDDLRAGGFTPMLISGGPELLVELLARELGVAHFRGTVFAEREGRFTGDIAFSGVTGKAAMVAQLAAPSPIAWSESLAMGNSLGDLELFEQAALRIAFDPSPELATLAGERGWQVAGPADVRQVLAMLLHGTAD